MDWTEIKNMQNKNKTRPSAPIFSENLTINNQFILHGLIQSNVTYPDATYPSTPDIRQWGALNNFDSLTYKT